MNERVLVIDDDAIVREVVRFALEGAGLILSEAAEGGAGLELAAARAPDVVVLDMMLPDLDGAAVLRELRRRSGVPILLLSARGDTDQRVEGLVLGADDFLPKPFSPRELVARVRALLRRAGGELGAGAGAGARLAFDGGRLAIDSVRHEVHVDGTQCDVTRSEFDLLYALAQHPGRVYSREEIACRLRGHEFEGDERVVDVHVRNLRRKIEADTACPRRVQTVRGVGYRLGVEPC